MATHLQDVDVIALYGADGSILPLRLQVQDIEGKLTPLRIERVLRHQEFKKVGIEKHVFLCRAVCSNRYVLIELQYHMRSHSWKRVIYNEV